MHRFAVPVAVVAVLLAGCGGKGGEFEQQLAQAGLKASSVHAELDSGTTIFEAVVFFRGCKLEFEQRVDEKRYYLDEVNDREPRVGLMKDSPNSSDVEAYLKGSGSPCRI